jgi:hypothetical protein
MQTMKQFLALIAAMAATACQAQASLAGHPPPNVRQVAMEQKPAPTPAPSFTPRRLSAQERAELRRQLSQYSRPAGKGS